MTDLGQLIEDEKQEAIKKAVIRLLIKLQKRKMLNLHRRTLKSWILKLSLKH